MAVAVTAVVVGGCLLVLLVVLCVLRAVALKARRRRAADATVFPCVVRPGCGSGRGLLRRRRATTCLGQWAQNVLLLHHGTWSTRTEVLPMRTTRGTIVPAAPPDCARLGRAAVVLMLVGDDGTEISVAAPSWAWQCLAGPFLVIAACATRPGLPGHLPS